MRKRNFIIPTLILGVSVLALAGCGSEKKDSEKDVSVEIVDNNKGNKDSNSTNIITSTPTPTPIPTPTEIPLEQQKFVAVDNVNVRRAPSTDGEIIDSFAPGDNVKVIGIENDLLLKQGSSDKWYKVVLYEGTQNETEGYVSEKYVKTETERENANQTPRDRRDVQNSSQSKNVTLDKNVNAEKLVSSSTPKVM